MYVVFVKVSKLVIFCVLLFISLLNVHLIHTCNEPNTCACNIDFILFDDI